MTDVTGKSKTFLLDKRIFTTIMQKIYRISCHICHLPFSLFSIPVIWRSKAFAFFWLNRDRIFLENRFCSMSSTLYWSWFLLKYIWVTSEKSWQIVPLFSSQWYSLLHRGWQIHRLSHSDEKRATDSNMFTFGCSFLHAVQKHANRRYCSQHCR